MHRVTVETKTQMEKGMKKMREGLEHLFNHMQDIEGLDPSSVGFIRHLATILDSGADIDHIKMLGDTTYNNFCEELEVVHSGECETCGGPLIVVHGAETSGGHFHSGWYIACKDTMEGKLDKHEACPHATGFNSTKEEAWMWIENHEQAQINQESKLEARINYKKEG